MYRVPNTWVRLFILVAMIASSGVAGDQNSLDRLGVEAADQEMSTGFLRSGSIRDFDPPVPIAILLKIGDTPTGGAALDALLYPSVGDGEQVAIGGRLATSPDADECMWIDGGVAWTASGAGLSATSIENWSGTNGDASDFITSVVLAPDSLDSVITAAGVLLKEEDPVPGLPGSFITFASRSLMTAAGVAYWVSGYADTQGGATQKRGLYRAADTTTPVIERVIGSDDEIGGFTVDTAFDFDYYVSDNDLHRILVLDTTEDSARDVFVAVDDTLVLREGDPVDGVENWDNFDNVQVNNSGRWIVSGDTDGDPASDEFLAVDGVIVAREGDTVAGVVLGSTVRLASINDKEQIAFVWTTDVGSIDEALFVATNPLAVSEACLLLRTGDNVDINGDGLIDGTVSDLDVSVGGAQTLQFQEDGWVFLRSVLELNTVEVDAVIGIRSPCLFSDGFETGTTSAWSAIH